MIKNVRTKGFKGESMDINLTGLDLIVGENGSGKTKILQSIEFALQSKVGSVKSNAELIAEFSNTEMSSTLTGDDFEVHRDLSGYMRKGEFKIDHNLSVKAGGQYETALKKADELISNELYVSPIVFNFSDFIDQSAADRRKYIMDLVGETSLTVEQIQNYVLSNATDLEPEETILLNKEIKELTGSIETMVKIADTKFKKWNAEQKETSAATRKIADIKSDLTANVALKGSLSEIKADLEVQVQNMREDFLRMQQHNAQVLSIDGTIGMLALNIRDLKMRDFASEINEHKAQYEAEKGKVVDPYREDVVVSAFEEYEALDADVKSIQNNITGLKQAKSAQEFKLAEAKMSRRNLEEKLNGLVANTCNMTGLPCTADLSEYKNGITTELSEVESLIDTILEIIRVNESDISENTNALSITESQKDASCARWLAFKQGNESAEKQNNIIQSRLDHINGMVKVLEAEQAGVGAQIANYQSQIDIQPVLTAYTDGEFDKIKMMGITTKNDLEATNSKLKL
jgi:chromosome segregation ATPase